ncbi:MULTISPECIES: hypothetical protein [unclassified Sphingomonas]|uniref:hypothetical protein n=1 Tax=unclassified Sphingomonas TaxID=196159 RepID=UPI00226AAD89|nr:MULTISPECIES: hypothetical protein [unclassified Sphingomonas]
MPKPTDERIAAALAQGARVTDVNNLIADMRTEIAEATSEADRLDAVSVAITTAEPDADAAADEATKHRRRATRMSAKVAHLEDRVKELEESNRRKVAEAAYAAAQDTRDAIVADLKKQWPKLTAAMIDLFKRIEASDAECAKVGSCYGKPALISAEAVARECLANFMLPTGGSSQHLERLTATRLFPLQVKDPVSASYGIWPPRPAPLSFA